MVSTRGVCVRGGWRVVGSHLSLIAALLALALAAQGVESRNGVPAGGTSSVLQEPAGMSLLESVGGAMKVVRASNSTAYVSAGGRLLPIDLSDPDHPRTVHRGWQLATLPHAIEISDEFAYVLGASGIDFVSISSPGSEVMHYSVANVADFTTYGHHAFLVHNSPDPLVSALISVGWHSPRHELADRLQLRDYYCGAIAAYQGFAYVSCLYPEKVHVIDISDPAEMQSVGEIDGLGWANDLSLVEGRLYAAAGGELRVFDLSQPDTPMPLGTLVLPAEIKAIQVVRNRAAMLLTNGDVQVANVSDPAAMQLIGSFRAASAHATELTRDCLELVGDEVVVAAGLRGAIVASVPDEGTARLRGVVPTFWAGDVHVVGDTAYVAAGRDGLLLVDSSSPGYLTVVGNLPLEIPAVSVFAHDGLAYILGSSGDAHRLFVVNIEDPSALEIVSELDIGLSADHVVADAGGLVVISGGEGAVRLIDASDPAAPRQLGALGDRTWAAHRALGGGFLFVSDWNLGLRVFEVTDPANPAEVSSVPFERGTGSLWLEGDLLYILAELQAPLLSKNSEPRVPATPEPIATAPPRTNQRIHLVDVGDPASPTVIDEWLVSGGNPWPTRLTAIEAEEERVYVRYAWAFGNHWESTNLMIGGEKVSEVQLVGSRAGGMSALGETLYVANLDGGLVELGPPEEQPVTPTPTVSDGPTDTATVTPEDGGTPTPTPTPTDDGGPAARLYLPLVVKAAMP